jgi:hypothetical protein
MTASGLLSTTQLPTPEDTSVGMTPKYSSSGHEDPLMTAKVSTPRSEDAQLSKWDAKASALAGEVNPVGRSWQGDRKENVKYRPRVEK